MNTTFKYRAGQSYFFGTIIDGYLNNEMIKLLYDKWQTSWGQLLEFQGNQKAITCEMILAVPKDELERVYQNAASEFLLVAERNAER